MSHLYVFVSGPFRFIISICFLSILNIVYFLSLEASVLRFCINVTLFFSFMLNTKQTIFLLSWKRGGVRDLIFLWEDGIFQHRNNSAFIFEVDQYYAPLNWTRSKELKKVILFQVVSRFNLLVTLSTLMPIV